MLFPKGTECESGSISAPLFISYPLSLNRKANQIKANRLTHIARHSQKYVQCYIFTVETDITDAELLTMGDRLYNADIYRMKPWDIIMHLQNQTNSSLPEDMASQR
jgi:hypothetical protein